jgi:hypothetical protein
VHWNSIKNINMIDMYTVQHSFTPYVEEFHVTKGWLWALNEQGDKIIVPETQFQAGDTIDIDTLSLVYGYDDEVYGSFKYYKKQGTSLTEEQSTVLT